MKKAVALNQLTSVQRVVLVTVGILLIPLLGRFPWGVFDFVIMGVLIFGTGMIIEWVKKNVSKKHQVLAVAAVLIGFFIIWAELAVGLVSQALTGELWIYDYIRMFI